jgi:FtsP/CotA-like multicopper oxidase with cupredoxin domain
MIPCKPVVHLDLSRATQQRMPTMELSFGWLATGAVGRRTAAVLLGLALLGAATPAREFDISIVGRRVEGTTTTIRVKRGDSVILRWRTDEAVSVHVHGYDIQAKLSPASSTRMRFEAGVAGRFAITAHDFGAVADHEAPAQKHRETTLLYLEVLPE